MKKRRGLGMLRGGLSRGNSSDAGRAEQTQYYDAPPAQILKSPIYNDRIE